MTDKKRLGRPTDNPKNTMLRIRMDNETLRKLDKCRKVFDTNRSDMIRKSIHKMYDDLDKK
ncbi:CopG family transcriptional regulator [Wukongibacter sp. M2B1]|uniref:CopG family transcriptional regulator n=1 Tax=Wukongibacter sp. M2B1 TaxID=3088895 RepID=UPI003D7A4C4F